MTSLVDAAPAPTYQMQSWDHKDNCTCPDRPRFGRHQHRPGCRFMTTTWFWEPMENGAAAAHWRPKKDARAAVRQAATWTGAEFGLCIPAMQVVELPSGRVIWRDSKHYPAAGEPIAPDWQDELYAALRAEAKAERAAERAVRQPEPTPAPEPIQEALF